MNVMQAVPFFMVSNMDASLRFYIDGLGFAVKHKWIDEGKLRWCWLEVGDAALMLQEFRKGGHDSWVPEGKVGVGVSICFICKDAPARRPSVENAMWVTQMTDPDGYKLMFESHTDEPEGTLLTS